MADRVGGGQHRQSDGDDPDDLVGARMIEDISAKPGAEEAAELVKQEHESREHRKVPDAEDARDDAVGERHRGEPGEADHGGENVRAWRAQRHGEQQDDGYAAHRIQHREDVGLGVASAQ